MINIAICDDEARVCAVLEEHVEMACKNLRIQADIAVYGDGKALHDALEEGAHFSLLFLDIELPHMDGVAIGDYIRDDLKDNTMQIAYISGKEGYAMELFHVRPIHFLMKPILYQQVEDILAKTVMLINELTKKFAFRINQNTHYLEYGNIMYFKSNNRKIQIVLPDGVREFYGKLETVYGQLPKREFLYIHKSYIVNISYIQTMRYESLILTDGSVLPIAQSKRKKIRCEQLGLSFRRDQ